MISLNVLDSRIDSLALHTREKHPWWPCAKGCDHCCRSLPHLPTITKAEWERLAPVLTDAQKERISALGNAPKPVACPLLSDDGACTVYDVRPITCRTYGYYVERDAGLHCDLVTNAVEAANEDVTWGNGEAIAEDLRAHGEERSLAEWLPPRGTTRGEKL